jgi:hypothetical protein
VPSSTSPSKKVIFSFTIPAVFETGIDTSCGVTAALLPSKVFTKKSALRSGEEIS